MFKWQEERMNGWAGDAESVQAGAHNVLLRCQRLSVIRAAGGDEGLLVWKGGERAGRQ